MATKAKSRRKASAKPTGTIERALAAVMDAGSSVVRSAEEFVGMGPKAKPRKKAKAKPGSKAKTKTKAKPAVARKSKAGSRRKATPK